MDLFYLNPAKVDFWEKVYQEDIKKLIKETK